jgi:hypothetical protein
LMAWVVRERVVQGEAGPERTPPALNTQDRSHTCRRVPSLFDRPTRVSSPTYPHPH